MKNIQVILPLFPNQDNNYFLLKFVPRIIAQVESIKKGSGKHTGETKLKDIQIISVDIV